MEKRIKDGLRCAAETASPLSRARVLEHEIYFADMDLVVTWPRAGTAFKQAGYALILGDEVSTWPEYSADMLRRRTATYAWAHIVCISSPDPQARRSSEDDPIFVEFDQTDQRYWMMPDPETGNLFRWEMGAHDGAFGLKWDGGAKREDGTWDLDAARRSAHYITPDGSRIENADRMRITRGGAWQPTAAGSERRRGYHLNAFHLPWKSSDFGEIAAAFLDAKSKGTQQLKVFVYEYLAEKWTETTESADNEALVQRCKEYHAKARISESPRYRSVYAGKRTDIIVSADLQKGHHWYTVREWIDGGESALVEWGSGTVIEDLRKIDEKYKAAFVYLDSGYKARRMECFEACFAYKWIPTIGSESLALPYKRTLVDPWEGRHGQGKYSLRQIMFHADAFKSVLLDMIKGESDKPWHVYNRIEREYSRQLLSEERRDGKWVKRRGHPDNHIWDCEVIQLVAATVEGIYRSDWFGQEAQ